MVTSYLIMAKYYIDTCIWIDYYENRSDSFRPLGEWAHAFFMNVNRKKEIILYSELVEDELSKQYSSETIKNILNIANRIQKVPVNNSIMKLAITIKYQRNIPKADAIHASCAKKHDAILISRDKHFIAVQDLIKCLKPEDLL